MRIVMAIAVLLLASCATQPRQTVCFHPNVIVTAADEHGTLVAPGTPIDIVVRSKSGRVLKEIETDRDGKASFDVCWSRDDPAFQIEARLHFEPYFAGTLASFYSNASTYCLTLPQRIGGHCGEWGTGPDKLLSGAGAAH